jgi:hypothetical protein
MKMSRFKKKKKKKKIFKNTNGAKFDDVYSIKSRVNSAWWLSLFLFSISYTYNIMDALDEHQQEKLTQFQVGKKKKRELPFFFSIILIPFLYRQSPKYKT